MSKQHPGPQTTTSPGARIWRGLGSIKLTVVLLFVIAAVSGVGTLELIPQNLDPTEYGKLQGVWGRVIVALGLDDFYTSPLLRLPFGLLLCNLMACGLRRSAAGVSDAVGRGAAGTTLALEDREAAARRLEAAGFRVHALEPFRASRRRWAFWGFPLVHLAPVLVVAGAFWGTTGGFIGTQQIHVGRLSDTVFDWSRREEVQMPFALHVRDFRMLYYPRDIRINVFNGGAEPLEMVVREQRAFPIPGTDFQGRVERFDIESGDMFYSLERGETVLGPYSRGKEEGAPLRFRPLGFRDSDLRRVEADVGLFEMNGVELESTTLAVNEPLAYEGYRIYVTAWGDDDKGQPFVGFQVTRDPGQELVWVGSILLTFGLFLLLFGDGGWAREQEGVLRVRAMRNRGALLKALAAKPETMLPGEPPEQSPDAAAGGPP